MIVFKDRPRKLTAYDMERLGAPRRHWLARVGKLPLSCKPQIMAVLSDLSTFLNKGDSLMFIGPSSAGKTATAVILGRRVIAHGGTALMISPAQAADAFADAPFDANESLLDRAMGVHLLVIDPLTDLDSARAATSAAALINQRYDDMRATVVVLGGNPDQLEKKYSRVWERLSGYFQPVLFDVEGSEENA